jgi:hypothetical protein
MPTCMLDGSWLAAPSDCELIPLPAGYRKSKSKLCYDQWSVGQSVLMSGTHLGCMTIFFPWKCYQAVVGLFIWDTSLKRGQACSIQFLLDLASAVLLVFESWRTHDCILCLNFEAFQTWRVRFLCLFSLEWGSPAIPPPPANSFKYYCHISIVPCIYIYIYKASFNPGLVQQIMHY